MGRATRAPPQSQVRGNRASSDMPRTRGAVAYCTARRLPRASHLGCDPVPATAKRPYRDMPAYPQRRWHWPAADLC